MNTTICTTCGQSVAIVAVVVRGRIEHVIERHGSCPSKAIAKVPPHETGRRRQAWRRGGRR